MCRGLCECSRLSMRSQVRQTARSTKSRKHKKYMNTRKNNSDKGQQLINSPFAGLSMNGGNISLDTPTAAANDGKTPQTESKTTVTAATTATTTETVKAPALRRQGLPRRGANSVLFQSRTPRVVAAAAVVATAPAASEKVDAVSTDLSNAPTVIPGSTPAAVAVAATTAAPALSAWDQLKQHMDNNTTVVGRVTRVIHGKGQGQGIVGIKVRVLGLDAFAPFRMLGLTPLETEHSMTLDKGFRIVEMVKGTAGEKDRIILNHNLAQTQGKTEALIGRSKIGDTIHGVVRNIKHFGAFIDVEGASALIHISDLPLGNAKAVKVGEQVTATVVKIEGKDRLGVSIKHHYVRGLTVGQTFSGPVKNAERFGVFVELGGTVDGLVHVSNFGKHSPKVGDNVTVKVVETDTVRAKVALSLVSVDEQPAS